jgi:hypothetical protein
MPPVASSPDAAAPSGAAFWVCGLCLGFGVWAVFGVWSLGCGVQGFGVGGWDLGLGFRVSGSGFGFGF